MGTVQHRQEVPIYHLAYSPDGKYVVTDGDDQQVRIWDAANGSLIRRIDAGEGWVRDFGFSSDGVLLDSQRRWPCQGRRRPARTDSRRAGDRARIDRTACTVHNRTIGIKFSSDGSMLAVRSFDGELRVLNTANGAESCRFKLTYAGAGPMAFSCAGDRLAAASGIPQAKYEIAVFDLGVNQLVRSIPAGGYVGSDLGSQPTG